MLAAVSGKGGSSANSCYGSRTKPPKDGEIALLTPQTSRLLDC